MRTLSDFISLVLIATWDLFLDASPYVLLGILVAGLLRMFLSPESIARHLGRGRFLPVVKASLLGVPLPLCSCGVLPAAVSLRKQGAGKGATLAFLISTPETGIDSIAISWALLDPILTVARPLVAFLTATLAGTVQNILEPPADDPDPERVGGVRPAERLYGGTESDPEKVRRHPGGKLLVGIRYAFGELWGDIAGWFASGMLLAGLITVLLPEDLITSVLGGGIGAMLLMLLLGVPLYICATASTPIAAALILKGVSPGAALVFLLVGPATNIAGITVLTGILGRRAVAAYLGSIAAVSVFAGLILDGVYQTFGIRAEAAAGHAADLVLFPIQFGSAIVLVFVSAKPLFCLVTGVFRKKPGAGVQGTAPACRCGGDCEE